MKMTTSSGRRTRVGAAVFALLLASQLTACGGGSSGSSGGGTATPPPTGSNPPPTTPPPPATVSLRLTGVVTDEPIANAQVTATVGDEQFTATAGSDGSYTLDIEVDEADASAFVTLSARGVGEQAFVEFKSLAGSLQSLIDQAGDDETLSNNENFSTQITNVSTAEAVLLEQANGGQPITSQQTLQNLASSINAQDVLDLSAAIKLAVDEPQTYPLAAGQTVLSLASNPTTRQAFVNEVYEQDPDAFSAMQAAIVNDSGLARPLTAGDVEDFTAALLSTEAGFTFNYTNRVDMFTFEEDGTGFATGASYDQAMTWALDGNKIAVSYTQPVTTVSFDFENCNGTARQVRAEYESAGATVAFISERTVAITSTSEVTYTDCPSLQPRTVTSTVARTVLNENDLQVIDAQELADSTQTIYVYDSATDQVIADIANINADGTGSTLLTQQSFTWELDDSNRIVSATFNDGTTAEYMSLLDVDDLTTDLFWEVRTAGNGPVYTDIGPSIHADPEYAVELTAQAVLGRFYQFGIGNESESDARLGGFRFRFDADGTGAQEDDYIDESNALVTIDETVDPLTALRWSIEQDELVLRRTVDISTNPATPNCVFGTTDCLLWDVRRIIPLAADESRTYVLEYRAFNVNGVTANTPRTSLVRFYDHQPFGTNAAANKPTLASVGSKPRALLRGTLSR